MTDDPAEHRWPHRWIYLPLARVVFGIILRILGRFKVRGRNQVPRTGGLLVVCNHLSDCDAVVVQTACPRPIHFMAKSELFEMKGIGLALKLFGAFPVKRAEADLGAVRRAVSFLKDGQVVCIFPEGKVSEDGNLQDLKPGVALLLRMSGVPVICGGIINSNLILPYGTTHPRFAAARVEFNWGEPYLFAKKSSAEEIMAWVESHLSELNRHKLT